MSQCLLIFGGYLGYTGYPPIPSEMKKREEKNDSFMRYGVELYQIASLKESVGVLFF